MWVLWVFLCTLLQSCWPIVYWLSSPAKAHKLHISWQTIKECEYFQWQSVHASWHSLVSLLEMKLLWAVCSVIYTFVTICSFFCAQVSKELRRDFSLCMYFVIPRCNEGYILECFNVLYELYLKLNSWKQLTLKSEIYLSKDL